MAVANIQALKYIKCNVKNYNRKYVELTVTFKKCRAERPRYITKVDTMDRLGSVWI